MSPVRQYELIYITPPDTTDEALAELQQQVQTVVDRFGGNIGSTEAWGRRRLAYEIAGHREGTYVLHVINGPAELNAELDGCAGGIRRPIYRMRRCRSCG